MCQARLRIASFSGESSKVEMGPRVFWVLLQHAVELVLGLVKATLTEMPFPQAQPRSVESATKKLSRTLQFRDSHF